MSRFVASFRSETLAHCYFAVEKGDEMTHYLNGRSKAQRGAMLKKMKRSLTIPRAACRVILPSADTGGSTQERGRPKPMFEMIIKASCQSIHSELPMRGRIGEANLNSEPLNDVHFPNPGFVPPLGFQHLLIYLSGSRPDLSVHIVVEARGNNLSMTPPRLSV